MNKALVFQIGIHADAFTAGKCKRQSGPIAKVDLVIRAQTKGVDGNRR
jgi:hypothetical protein